MLSHSTLTARKMAHFLRHTQLVNLKPRDKAYKVTDGGGLFLEVQTSGHMAWRYQYVLHGKREKVTLGTFREAGAARERIIVGIEQARNAHTEAKKLVARGESPARAKQTKKSADKADAERSAEFKELGERWFAAHVADKSASWQRSVRCWLDGDIYPVLGARDPRKIEEFHVQRAIDKVVERGSLTSAAKVRTIIQHIFAHGKRKGEVTVNPALTVETVTQAAGRSHRALTVREIAPFLKALEADSARPASKLAIRLLMLTLVRKDELRLAKWSEFDFDNHVWDLPGHRMKMGDAHRVYLSSQALELLGRLRELARGSEYVLPSYTAPTGTIGRTTFNSVVDRLDIQGGRFVPHGFRATASSILNERGYRMEVIELSLAHRERNKVRGTYNQSQYSQERAEMFQWWSDYVDSLQQGSNIIPGRFNRAA